MTEHQKDQGSTPDTDLLSQLPTRFYDKIIYMIDEKFISSLTSLSNVGLAKEKHSVFAKELDGVLGYVAEVQNIAGSDESFFFSQHHKNVFRTDVVTTKRGEYKDALLSQAKEQKNGWVKSPAYVFI